MYNMFSVFEVNENSNKLFARIFSVVAFAIDWKQNQSWFFRKNVKRNSVFVMVYLVCRLKHLNNTIVDSFQ